MADMSTTAQTETSAIKIVLDTNVIFQHRLVDGPSFDLLDEFLRDTGSTLFVPQIVFEEAIKKSRDRINETLVTVSRETRKLRGALVAPFCEIDEPKIDVEEAVDAYSRQLDERIEALGASKPEYKDIVVDRFVQRALEERRPFMDKDRGFRDAVLWETMLEHIVSSNHLTVLLTNDNGFIHQEELHPHLREDLVRHGHDEKSVVVVRSIDDLLKRFVKPVLALRASPFERVREGIYKSLDLKEFLPANQQALLDGSQRFVDDVIAEAQHWVEEIRYVEGDYMLVDLQIGDDPQVEEVYGIDGGRGFMKVNIACIAAIDGFMHKSDYYCLHDDSRIAVMDSNWNDHSMWVQVEIKSLLTVNLTIDEADGRVHSVEVESLSANEPEFTEE